MGVALPGFGQRGDRTSAGAGVLGLSLRCSGGRSRISRHAIAVRSTRRFIAAATAKNRLVMSISADSQSPEKGGPLSQGTDGRHWEACRRGDIRLAKVVALHGASS